MKKFYTTLVVVLMATMGFAQVTPLEGPKMSSPVLKEEIKSELAPVDMKKISSRNRAGSGAFEYSYFDAIYFLNGELPNRNPAPILSDTLVRAGFADGSGGTEWATVQRYSVGAIYDFASRDWTELYRNYEDLNGDLVSVPDFGMTRNFNVDSVGIQFLYVWGSEVPANTVDTLIVSVAAVEDLPYSRIYLRPQPGEDTVWRYSWAEIPWDRYGDAVFTSDIPGAADVKYYKHKHYLTIEDTSVASGGGNILINNVYTPLPESFKNLTNQKQIVVAYSFKSGSRNPNVAQRYNTDTIGRQVNSFRAMYFSDPRSEYDHPAGNDNWSTPQLLADRNLSLDVMEYSLIPDLIWTNNYVNATEWFGLLNRPLMSVVASCNDCEWINVKEMEKRNITITPNPATENFRLDLDGNGAAQVELYNMTGQLMHKEQVNDQTVTVNVNNFNSGMYILRVVQEGKVYTAKVMVK